MVTLVPGAEGDVEDALIGDPVARRTRPPDRVEILRRPPRGRCRRGTGCCVCARRPAPTAPRARVTAAPPRSGQGRVREERLGAGQVRDRQGDRAQRDRAARTRGVQLRTRQRVVLHDLDEHAIRVAHAGAARAGRAHRSAERRRAERAQGGSAVWSKSATQTPIREYPMSHGLRSWGISRASGRSNWNSSSWNHWLRSTSHQHVEATRGRPCTDDASGPRIIAREPPAGKNPRPSRNHRSVAARSTTENATWLRGGRIIPRSSSGLGPRARSLRNRPGSARARSSSSRGR